MKLKSLVTAAAIVAGVPGAAGAVEVLKSDTATLNVGGRLQLLGFAQHVDDTFRNDARAYMFLKQARLQMHGNVEDWRFKLSLAMGGEVEVKAPTPGVALDLLDLYVDVPTPLQKTYVRVGQFKVPYSRERLIDSDTILFGDRSIQNLGFRMGRDVGAALFTNQGKFAGGLGIFTGGGGGVPQRFLPQNLGLPMLAVRLGVDSAAQENVFAERASNAMPEALETAFFVNGFFVKDSQVGHSSVFATRPMEKSLMLNGNWNPYIAQAPVSMGKLWQVGADTSVRAPMGPGAILGEAELNYAVYQNDYGDIRMPGGRVQLAYALEAIPLTIATRYAIIKPDENFRAGGNQITGTKAIQELTPSLNYQFAKFPVRIVADLPIQMNVPVVMENNVGAYLLTEQADQASLLKPGANGAPSAHTVGRQDVVEARLMFQAAF